MSRSIEESSSDSDVEEEYRDQIPIEISNNNDFQMSNQNLRHLQGITDIEQYIRTQNVLMAMQLAFGPISRNNNQSNNNNNNNEEEEDELTIDIAELQRTSNLEQQRNRFRMALLGLEELYRNQIQHQQILFNQFHQQRNHHSNIESMNREQSIEIDDDSSDSSLEENYSNNITNRQIQIQIPQTQIQQTQQSSNSNPVQFASLDPLREEDVAHLTTQERIELHRARLIDRQNAIEGSALDLPITHNDPYDWTVEPTRVETTGIRSWINFDAFRAQQMKGWSIFILAYGFAGNEKYRKRERDERKKERKKERKREREREKEK